MGGPENVNFPLLYLVKFPYVGGWVVQKSLKTPLRNIKMAPYQTNCSFFYRAVNFKRVPKKRTNNYCPNTLGQK